MGYSYTEIIERKMAREAELKRNISNLIEIVEITHSILRQLQNNGKSKYEITDIIFNKLNTEE